MAVGDAVTLSCPRQKFEYGAKLFWVRMVSGNFHEVLGGTSSIDYDKVQKTLHFTTKQEPEAFVLHTRGIQRSDAGVYDCVKVKYLEMTFLKRTFLGIRGKNQLN